MIPIYIPLLTAALVAAVTSTMVYHQARQNRLYRECVLAITRNHRKQEFRAQHHAALDAPERQQQLALDLAA